MSVASLGFTATLLAQDPSVLPAIPQGPAWAVGGAIILWVLTYMVKTILELRWSKGSEAIIKERETSIKARELEIKEKELDIEEISAAYERKIKEIGDANLIRNREMQAHIDIIDKKLDASESRERECAKNLANLEGRLQILEALNKVDTKVAAALTNQKTIAEAVDHNLADKLEPH